MKQKSQMSLALSHRIAQASREIVQTTKDMRIMFKTALQPEEASVAIEEVKNAEQVYLRRLDQLRNLP